MANSDKNILITPNINAADGVFPTIRFTGQVNTPVTLSVLDDNSLSFTGSVGQLFSITNSLTGTIFSVNDISGIPSIEVLDTGTVRLAQYGGNVGIGNSTPLVRFVATGTGTSAAMPTLGTASGVSYISASTGTYGLLTGVQYSSGDVWMQAQRTDGNTTPYSILLNPSGGNVAIGASAATANIRLTLSDTNTVKLTLTGGSSQNGMYFNTVSSANRYYIGSGNNLLAGGDRGFLIYDDTNARAKFFTQDVTGETRVLGTTFLTNYTNGAERMRIDSAGNTSFTGSLAPGLIIGKENTGGTILNSNDSGSISIRGNATTQSAAMSFHRTGNYAINMGLDTDNNFKIGGWSAGAIMMTLTPGGNLTVPGQLISTVASGTSPLAVTSTTLVSNLNANLWMGYQRSDRTNWGTNSAVDIVVGQLGWKNYSNNHTIFDASQGTAPNGTAISNVDPQVTWTGTYPTLMGWNGANTYGVRVDLARYAEYDPKRIGITTPALRNISASTSGPSGGQDGDVWIQYT
jgi:hypothetical protein